MNLDGFVTKEQNFDFLHRAADDKRRQDYQKEQHQQQRQNQKNAAGKFLVDYLDPKAHLTGTAYDPQIIKGFGDLLQEGINLANQGADNNTLLMALGSKVNKLNQYSQTAKLVDGRIKQQLANIPKNAGYNIAALENEAKKLAFYNQEGQLKNIDDVDPEMDWLTETVKLKPEAVTTDAGLDEFVKSSAKTINKKKVATYTNSGALNSSNKKITSTAWQVPDYDERGAMTGLVPKYQTAIDGGQPLMHDFTDASGKKVKAPVRLLDESEFKSMMASNSGIADWVRGQVKQHIGEYGDGNIDINSPQATMVARAILYDELNRRYKGSIEDDEIIEKPSVYETKNYWGYTPGGKGGGSGTTDTPINDVYKEVKDLGATKQGHIPFHELSIGAQNILINHAKNVLGDEKLGMHEVYIKKHDNDSYDLMKVKKDAKGKVLSMDLITKLDEKINIKAQPTAKGKNKVIEKINQQSNGNPAPAVSDWKSRAKPVK
jgi:hypothetical protein